MPKTIIFDWDDTLAHTRPAVVEAMEYVLKKYNKEPWEITKTKYRDTKKSLKENFPNFFGDQAQEAYQDYLNYYTSHGYSKVTPLENANSFLRMCNNKNIDIYIISNKEKSLLQKEVSFCYPTIKFKNILGNGDAANNKPSADPVYKALENSKSSINKNNVWLIGDTKQDTECAYNAGVQPMLLGKGKFMQDDYIKDKQKTSTPIVVFNNYEEIISYTSKVIENESNRK
jgi:phosphoglycolate phosphatase